MKTGAANRNIVLMQILVGASFVALIFSLTVYNSVSMLNLAIPFPFDTQRWDTEHAQNTYVRLIMLTRKDQSVFQTRSEISYTLSNVAHSVGIVVD